jgi:transcriptional regulator with XRE-family HTH domain
MDPLASLPPWMDRYKASQMVQYRALGFNQAKIAERVGVSQQTVSRYMAAVNESAQQSPNLQEFLLSIVMIGAGVALFAALMKNAR